MRIRDIITEQRGVAEGSINESALFLNPNAVIVGQEHGQPLNLSPETLKRVQSIAAKHGAWYEGNGADRAFTKGVIDNYVGSFDDDVAATMANPNDPKWIYVLFANVDANNRVQRVGVDPKDTIFNRLLDTAKDNSFQGIGFTAQALKKFLAMSSEGQYDFVRMSQQPATQENLTRFLKAGEALMWPANWEQYPNKAGKIAKAATVDARDQYLASRKAGVYVVGSGHLKAVQQLTGKQDVREGQLDPYRLERLDPQSRRVLQRMADHAEPGSWLSASEAYAIMLGLQYKRQDPRGWEQEVQHYVDLWREITGNKNLEEDWRKWVAGGAMTAAAMAPMAAQAQAYQRAPDATAALQTLRKDDSRIQQNQSTQQLAKVIYAQMVKERGQPMDARQQQKWMTIAQEKAAAQIQQKQQPSTAAKNSRSNLIQPSEYRRSPMMDKDW